MALLNKPGNELLIDLINEANNLQITPGMLTFGAPQVVDPPAPRNTDIVATPTEELPTATGPTTFNYQRLNLNVLLGGLPKGFEEDETGILTTADLLPLLNDRFNLAMTEEDIVVESIIRDGMLPLSVTLTASATSLTYVGSVVLRLEEPKDTGGGTLAAAFFISNSTVQATTWDLEQYNNISGEEKPISSEFTPILFANSRAGLIIGVRNTDENNGVIIYRSDDGGSTWFMNVRAGLTLVGNDAVMFKDGFYVALRDSAIDPDSFDENAPCGVYRIWWNGDFIMVFERVMDLMGGHSIDRLQIACNEDYLVVYANGELHLTNNGVVWAKWPLPLDGGAIVDSTLQQWELMDLVAARPGTANSEYFYAVGKADDYSQSPGHHLALIRFRVYAGETGPAINNLNIEYGSGESTNGLPYPWYDATFENPLAWSIGSVALHCTLSGALLMGIGYLQTPSEGGILMGSIWRCPEDSLDNGWMRVHDGNGVNNGRFLENEDAIIFYGINNVMMGGTENMVYSDLEGSNWQDDPAGTESPFKANPQELSSVAARNTESGEILFQEEIPNREVTTQTLPAQQWFNGLIEAGIQTSDARALLGGQFETAADVLLNTNVIKLNDPAMIDPEDLSTLLDPFFNPVVEGPVLALCEGSNGGGSYRFYIGGAITQVNGFVRPSLAAITISGTIDENFAAVDLRDANNLPATVRGVFIEPGTDKPFIYGDFVRVNDVIRRGIARLNLDGTLDETFNAGFTDSATEVNYAEMFGTNVLIGGSNLPNETTLVAADTGAVVVGNVFENKPAVKKVFFYNGGRWVVYAYSTLDGQHIAEFYSTLTGLTARDYGAAATGAAIQVVHGASIVNDQFHGQILAINAQYNYESPGIKGQFGRDLQYFSLSSGSGVDAEYAPYDVEGRVNFIHEFSFYHILYGSFSHIREDGYPRYHRKLRSNVARMFLGQPEA